MTNDESYRREELPIGKAEIIQPKDNRFRQITAQTKNYDETFAELYRRIDELERTLAGLQILLGKASEYKARPKRERLP